MSISLVHYSSFLFISASAIDNTSLRRCFLKIKSVILDCAEDMVAGVMIGDVLNYKNGLVVSELSVQADGRIQTGKNMRHRQDSNLRGGTPTDFESVALTTRPRCRTFR
eukprot:scaffold10700_cov108-Cylindrotheca_fusiformis.AAC.7